MYIILTYKDNIMNKYPIFYVINGQFYENSDSNSQKLNKITLIFENENPKSLRSSALKKFTEIRNTLLIKNNAAAPIYHRVNNIGQRTCVDAIENVPFYTEQSKLSLALTLSFGIKESTRNLNLIDSDRYPYNKNLHPIAAIGKSLQEIENSLKINLILEKQFYEIYNEELSEINNIKNFVKVDFLKDYIISNCNKSKEIQKVGLLTKVLRNKTFDIFPTPQFYSYKTEEVLMPSEASFLELFEHSSKNKQLKKQAIYKKELENISEFYRLLNGLDSLGYTIFRKLNRLRMQSFFTKKQCSIYDEIATLENKFNNNSAQSNDMRSLIEKFL
jgi:hypothetical protein